MMIPIDTIMALVVVVGVFAYYALKSSGKKAGKAKDKKAEKDFYMWLAEGIDRRNHDETKRNQRWVEEHFKG